MRRFTVKDILIRILITIFALPIACAGSIIVMLLYTIYSPFDIVPTIFRDIWEGCNYELQEGGDYEQK